MNSVFVTGTDTGVGKTVLTAAICAASGATPMKPVQTGSMEAEDLAFVVATTGRSVPAQLACPYRFADPLAPAVAARRAGEDIDVEYLVQCYKQLSRSGAVVVEGAGGILVEVRDGMSMADLARLLDLPVVIACRPGLGTLNHSALTVEAARSRGLEILGLVIVGWGADASAAAVTNPPELARIAPVVGVIPHIDGLDTEHRHPMALGKFAAEFLSPALGGSFDADDFLAKF
ncbi:MAG: dethiobiotin synthase [Actinomycetota bacterium]